MNQPTFCTKILQALSIITILVLLNALISPLMAQPQFYKKHTFTRADTLRGALSPERACFDVYYYDLDLAVNIENQSIQGFVDVYYKATENFTRLQLDLYANMTIDGVEFQNKKLEVSRQGDAFFVTFPKKQAKGATGVLRVNYHGQPRSAQNPPWDGGFVWKADSKGNPWIGVACEGDGASLWWPNKDHLSDEPDSMAIRIKVPAALMAVANGNLRKTENLGQFKKYHWAVSYPINNYNVTLNIADYAHFTDEYLAKDGSKLPIDYYVLRSNEAKARDHFKQTLKVLECYEHYFDKYPFWNDGFALVETPYLGMEHQSAIAYGNNYQRGYLGGMIPRDMNWDYIIVHEAAHEYFGNSISCNDIAEMWIHESFATYMEALYVEFTYSYKDAIRYLNSQRAFILNKEPIIGPFEVNWDNWEGSDHYYKGAWMLHTLRHAIGDDQKWWGLLKGFYQKYAISNVRTQDFTQYVNQYTGRNFDAFFEQYLSYPDIPTFIYKLEQQGADLKLSYKWRADVNAFNMSVLVGNSTNYTRLEPTTEWQETIIKDLTEADFKVATELFYVRKKQEK